MKENTSELIAVIPIEIVRVATVCICAYFVPILIRDILIEPSGIANTAAPLFWILPFFHRYQEW